MKYVIDLGVAQSSGAVSKPREDVDLILGRERWTRINLYDLRNKKPRRQIHMFWTLLKMYFTINSNDLVLVQGIITLPNPLSDFRFERLIKGRKILLLHDIDSLRYGQSGFYEKAYYSMYDGIVAHTDNMKQWLEDHGITQPIYTLKAFDYLLENGAERSEPVRKNGKYEIVFAGSFSGSKSSFLYQGLKPEEFYLKLYGDIDKPINTENISCEGAFLPDELTKHISGHFGLVWAGESAEGCRGSLGDYLRYNCPHKFSLYMAVGLPVIIWSQAALAEFVRENHIGICVDNLYQIDQILKDMTEEQYMTLCRNVAVIQHKVTTGTFLMDVIREIESV